MAHNKTPDWFYPDELDLEVGMSNLQFYPSEDKEEAGWLIVAMDDGDGEKEGEMVYADVAELYAFLGEWLIWAEEHGYGE